MPYTAVCKEMSTSRSDDSIGGKVQIPSTTVSMQS